MKTYLEALVPRDKASCWRRWAAATALGRGPGAVEAPTHPPMLTGASWRGGTMAIGRGHGDAKHGQGIPHGLWLTSTWEGGKVKKKQRREGMKNKLVVK